MDGCFSQDYVEAREKFAAAARAAGAELTGFALDKRGPDGGTLSTDVAWLGPPDVVWSDVTHFTLGEQGRNQVEAHRFRG